MEVASGVEIVESLPVVYVRRIKAVVLADLHLGFEEEAAHQGYFIPRTQVYRALQILAAALDTTGAEWVIFAGDVKHCFSRLLRSEREELSMVFEFLKKRGLRVTVVRGNHDSYLALVAKKYGVEILNELVTDDILIVHGHKKLPERAKEGVKLVIMGHEHPSLRLRDRLGVIAKLPCFLKAPLKKSPVEVVVLPAVGQYQTGTTVSLYPTTYLSPILREEADLERAKPFVLAEDLGVIELPELASIEDLLVVEV